MTAMRESRTEKRAIFDTDQRITLLEQDGDTFEDAFIAIQKQLSKLVWFAFGSLVSFTTASIFLVINLLAQPGGLGGQ